MDLGNTSGARRPTRSPRSRSDRSLSGAATTVCGEGTRPRPGGLPSDRCASSSARSRARARTAVMCPTSSNRRPSAHCRKRVLDRLPRPLVGRRLLARKARPNIEESLRQALREVRPENVARIDRDTPKLAQERKIVARRHVSEVGARRDVLHPHAHAQRQASRMKQMDDSGAVRLAASARSARESRSPPRGLLESARAQRGALQPS